MQNHLQLLVVLAVLGVLLGIAAPRYAEHVDRAREAVLRQNLTTLRDAIDKFKADQGHYPAELPELVRKRYLRVIPHDPVTQSTAWSLLASPVAGEAGIHDVSAPVASGAADMRTRRSGIP